MKCQEPGPPLLFTMIMKQMVMPRTTSSESRRLNVVGAVAGLVMVGEVTGVVIEGRLRETGLPSTVRAEGAVRPAEPDSRRSKATDEIQGYYFSKPLGAEGASDLLRRRALSESASRTLP